MLSTVYMKSEMHACYKKVVGFSLQFQSINCDHLRQLRVNVFSASKRHNKNKSVSVAVEIVTSTTESSLNQILCTTSHNDLV